MIHSLPIAVDQAKVADFCRRRHIIKFSLFGSVLTESFGPDSDIDVLVEFDRAHIPNLFDVVEMEFELSELFGRKVDLRTSSELSEYFRDQVIRSAFVQYAA